MGKKIADEKEKKGGRLIMVPDEYPIANDQYPLKKEREKAPPRPASV